MNKKIDIKELQKDIYRLGILSIEADGEISPECMLDAVHVVKSTNIDFANFVAEIREKLDSLINDDR